MTRDQTLSKLFTVYHGGVVKRCRIATSNQQDAEDIASDAWLRLCKSRREPDLRLLNVIVTRSIVDWRRKRGVRNLWTPADRAAKKIFENVAYGDESRVDASARLFGRINHEPAKA